MERKGLIFAGLGSVPRGLSKQVISRFIGTSNGVTQIVTVLITDLLNRLGLQVGFRACHCAGFEIQGPGLEAACTLVGPKVPI